MEADGLLDLEATRTARAEGGGKGRCVGCCWEGNEVRKMGGKYRELRVKSLLLESHIVLIIVIVFSYGCSVFGKGFFVWNGIYEVVISPSLPRTPTVSRSAVLKALPHEISRRPPGWDVRCVECLLRFGGDESNVFFVAG